MSYKPLVWAAAASKCTEQLAGLWKQRWEETGHGELPALTPR